MTSDETPRLDERTAQTIVARMLARLPGYVPGWTPAEASPGLAVMQVFARYVQALIERLNQAPDKNKLAFLDMLGINLLPAQPARAPIVFEPMENVGDSRVQARTRVGAKPPGQGETLVFETLEAIALAAARLVEVVTLWPARDSYADHSAAAARGEPFTLFKPLGPMPHELYLAHDVVLALVGKSTVELLVELAAGATPLAIAWEYWDGERWQGFKEFGDVDQPLESFDGTEGLSRGGVIRLVTECGDVVKTKVQGIETYWVRGRLSEPLPPAPGARLPAIDRIRLRTVIERPLGSVASCTGGIQPDQAFADATKLDMTKSFFPLGRNPDRNSAFYFTSEEVFSKAGAEVTLCLSRAETPEEEADLLEAQLLEETARRLILDSADKVAQSVIDAGKSVLSLGLVISLVSQDMAPYSKLDQKIKDLGSAKNSLQTNTDVSTLVGPTNEVSQAIEELKEPVALAFLALSNLTSFPSLMQAATDSTVKITSSAQDALDTLAKLGALVTAENTGKVLEAARWASYTICEAARSLINLGVANLTFLGGFKEVTQLESATADLTEISAIEPLAEIAKSVVKAIDQEAVSFIATINFFGSDKNKTVQLVSLLHQASTNAQAVLPLLIDVSKIEGAGTVGAETKALAPPRLLWEYWNGEGWALLLGPVDDAPANFLDKGKLSFIVPNDMAATSVNNVKARWLRVRIGSGTFGRLRMVSWRDEASGKVNLMSIIEPRPPALERFLLGYTYRSPKTAPDYCFDYNDFQYEDRSQAVRWPGSPFNPFRPTADRTPALYLGFDRPLPADLISLYFNIEEVAELIEGLPLKWEYHDGSDWAALTVEDETARLALPGMVAAIWPGVPAPPPATVLRASGTEVQLVDARQAARIAPGSRLYIDEKGEGELVEVAEIARDTLMLKRPLGRSYGQATIGVAALPRFGRPRTWIRARLEVESEPPFVEFQGIYHNAAWAAQIQTTENESLGSSTAQAGQVLFFRHTPVLEGEVIEVRELSGARAAVELPILREELLLQGMSDADLRTVEDRRTGQVSEVWVRWRVRPNLFFSGPGDRDVVIERTRGRLIFGDNTRGRIAPVGAENVRAMLYRSGGGLAGNVGARAISQLMSGVLAQSVSNPRAAEGGADGESVEAVLTRGPQAVRHRRQALSRADYEALAREASPAVAVARALASTHPNGRPAPGWVTIIIVPQSLEAEPQPSFQLRSLVREFLMARVPAAMAGLAVIGPRYLRIGVEAVVAPRTASEAGPVGERVRRALASFLHPLTGGPEGAGWAFGRNVYLSDVAATLEAIEGVDYVETINLLLDGTPRGEMIAVPTDRIVVAGPVQVQLKARER